jgi:hypothetical protein
LSTAKRTPKHQRAGEATGIFPHRPFAGSRCESEHAVVVLYQTGSAASKRQTQVRWQDRENPRNIFSRLSPT